MHRVPYSGGEVTMAEDSEIEARRREALKARVQAQNRSLPRMAKEERQT